MLQNLDKYLDRTESKDGVKCYKYKLVLHSVTL